MTDNLKMFKNVYSKLEYLLPDGYWKNIILRHENIYYPDKIELPNLFKTCNMAKFFLPYHLAYDSVIYLDTDIIFMRPPEDLWREFKNFDKNQFAGLTPMLSTHYKQTLKVGELRLKLKLNSKF